MRNKITILVILIDLLKLLIIIVGPLCLVYKIMKIELFYPIEYVIFFIPISIFILSLLISLKVRNIWNLSLINFILKVITVVESVAIVYLISLV